MSTNAQAVSESLVPVVRYRNVAAAAQWLCAAFGFEQKTLVNSSDAAAPDGTAIYAELIHGRGTIMLVPVGQSDLDAHMRQPDELGGIETQTCYVTVSDASAHMERAILGGAEIVLPLSGGHESQRGYSCRDIEGHLWNFGTYTPASASLAAARADPAMIASQQIAPAARSRVMPVMTLGLVGLAAWAWAMPDNPLASTAASLFEKTTGRPLSLNPVSGDALARAQAELQSETRRSQETILKLRQEAAGARATAKAAETAANAASKDLAAEYTRRTQAEHGGGDAAARAAKLDADLAASKDSIAHLENELLKERSARGQSVLAAESARNDLAQEIKHREHLEQIVEELDRKADDRLQAKLDDPQRPAAKAPAAPSVTVPAVTGSVGPRDTSGVSEAQPEASPEAKVDEKTDAPGRDGDSSSLGSSQARTKSVQVKRPKPAAQTPAAKKSASSKSKEDKTWPYNAW